MICNFAGFKSFFMFVFIFLMFFYLTISRAQYKVRLSNDGMYALFLTRKKSSVLLFCLVDGHHNINIVCLQTTQQHVDLNNDLNIQSHHLLSIHISKSERQKRQHHKKVMQTRAD